MRDDDTDEHLVTDEMVERSWKASTDVFARSGLFAESQRAALEAVAADIAARTVASAFRALADHYPESVFPESGTSRDAIAGTALRTVPAAQADLWERGEQP